MSTSNLNSITEAEADALLQRSVQRSLAGAGGLSQAGVGIIQQVRLAATNQMLRAGTGMIGQQIRQREVIQLVVLIDQSGSMLGEKVAIPAGLNDMVDDLKSERNPQRDQIELTVWVFNNNSASLLEVTDASGNRLEVANIPVTKMPKVTEADYNPNGSTPLYKAILAALGGGSIRAEHLLGGVGGAYVRVASTLFVVATDGLNTLKSETVQGNLVRYTDADVRKVVADLRTTEQWQFFLAYAGTDSTPEAEGKRLGFDKWRAISGGGWRAYFGIVSQSAKQFSKAVTSGSTGAAASVNGFTTP